MPRRSQKLKNRHYRTLDDELELILSKNLDNINDLETYQKYERVVEDLYDLRCGEMEYISDNMDETESERSLILYEQTKRIRHQFKKLDKLKQRLEIN
jgi:hypothetical protein